MESMSTAHALIPPCAAVGTDGLRCPWPGASRPVLLTGGGTCIELAIVLCDYHRQVAHLIFKRFEPPEAAAARLAP
jgi:hypothetical protein